MKRHVISALEILFIRYFFSLILILVFDLGLACDAAESVPGFIIALFSIINWVCLASREARSISCILLLLLIVLL